jgi:hypothetical protein
MEPEGSLPCSQQPATGTSPEQDASNPHFPPPHLPKISSNIILPSTPRSSGWSLHFRFSYHLISDMRATCPAHLNLLDHPNNMWWSVYLWNRQLRTRSFTSTVSFVSLNIWELEKARPECPVCPMSRHNGVYRMYRWYATCSKPRK